MQNTGLVEQGLQEISPISWNYMAWGAGGRREPDLENLFADTVRDAAVLYTLYNGEYDSYMQIGSSVRVRDIRSGYFRFVIGDGDDIKKLTEDVSGYIIAVDARHEDIWRECLPEAVIKRYRLIAATRDMLRRPVDKTLPEKAEFVWMDESWDDFVIEKNTDEEFTADVLRQQIRVHGGVGLLMDGERAGFMMQHLDGEMGPIWVKKEFRNMGFAAWLTWEYLDECLKKNPIIYGLIDPENPAPQKVTRELGFKSLEDDVLHITVRDSF